MELSFWRNKHVLVTGGAGFLGGQVVKTLRASGCAQVFVPRKAQFDLREKDRVTRLFEQTRPDTVFHLAGAVGGIGFNRTHPGQLFYDNAIMGIQVVEIARRFQAQKLICVGTVCSYPKFTNVPFREETLWEGYPEETNAPYGLAKKMLLTQALAYRKEYGFNAIYLLPTNVYGPGDNFDPETSHVIRALIRKFTEAKRQGQRKIAAWGTGSSSRDFLYVEDAALGIVLAAEHYDKPEPANLGSGEEVTIRELVGLIGELIGYHPEIEWDTSQPDGQPRRCLDTSRAEREFGFKARTKLQDGLSTTIAWYQKVVCQRSRGQSEGN